MKTIYNYAPDTGIYVEESEAFESPLEPGVYLIPAYATETEPPNVSKSELARYDAKKCAWEVIDDIRGTWYDADGREIKIDDLDADVSALTRNAPPSALCILVDGKWKQCPKKAAAAKKAEMDTTVATGMAEANSQIAVLQDAVDLEMATIEEAASLKAWKKYRVLLTRAHADARYPDVTLPRRPDEDKA
jgi:hypothetical protein